MAEFSEVMKQLARMANACNGECDKCPLDYSVLCTGPWCYGNTEGIAEAERIVMQWAAENPEPVYPTWEQYLADLMTADMKADKTDNPNSVENYMRKTQIPADIAEKLELNRKRYNHANQSFYGR